MLSPNPLRIFYALSLVACMYYADQIRKHARGLEHAEWLWPMQLFPTVGFVYFSLAMIVVGVFALAVLRPQWLILRAAAAFAWLLLIALAHPNGYVGHSFYIWQGVALALV